MPWGVRYTDELGTAICERLARGESLRKMYAEPGYPDRHTIARWTREHPQFREQYEQARLLWADEIFEEIAELGEDARRVAEAADAKGHNSNAAVAAIREEIRAKIWVCARLRPDKYGDRISTEITGPGGKDLIPERAADPDRIAQALIMMIAAPAPGTAAVSRTCMGDSIAPQQRRLVGSAGSDDEDDAD